MMPCAGRNCWSISRFQRFAGLGLEDYDCGVISAGALLTVSAGNAEKFPFQPDASDSVYVTGKYMMLDSSTRRNLELCETLREKQKRGSLLWVLDKTKNRHGSTYPAKVRGAASD